MSKRSKIVLFILVIALVSLLSAVNFSVVAYADSTTEIYFNSSEFLETVAGDYDNSFMYKGEAWDFSKADVISCLYYNRNPYTQSVGTDVVEADVSLIYSQGATTVTPLELGTYTFTISIADIDNPAQFKNKIFYFNFNIVPHIIDVEATAVITTYGTVAALPYTINSGTKGTEALMFNEAGNAMAPFDNRALYTVGHVGDFGANIGVYPITIGDLIITSVNSFEEENYSINFIGSTYTINKKNIHINNISCEDKVFDNNDVASLVDPSGNSINSSTAYYFLLDSDRVLSDSQTAVYLDRSAASATFAQSDVGNDIPVSINDVILAGAKRNNYKLVSDTIYADITAREVRVIADSKTREYNPNHTGGDLTYDVVNADMNLIIADIGITGLTEIQARARFFTGNIVRDAGEAVADYTIDNTGATPLAINDTDIEFNADNYSLVFTTNTYTITTYTVHIIPESSDLSKVYGYTDPDTIGYTISELTPEHAGYPIVATLSREDPTNFNVGEYDVLGEYTIGGVVYNPATNLDYTFVIDGYEEAFVINARPITLTCNDIEIDYDGDDIFPAFIDGEYDELLTFDYVLAGTLVDDDIMTVTLSSDRAESASTYTITIEEADVAITRLGVDITDNYNITLITGNYTVNKVSLPVRLIEPLRKSFNDEDPSIFSFNIDGIENVGLGTYDGLNIELDNYVDTISTTHVFEDYYVGASSTLSRTDGEVSGFYALSTEGITIHDELSVDVTANFDLVFDEEIEIDIEIENYFNELLDETLEEEEIYELYYSFEIYRDEIFIVGGISDTPFNGAPIVAEPTFYNEAEHITQTLIADYDIVYYNDDGNELTVPQPINELLTTPIIPGTYSAMISFPGTLNYLPKDQFFNYTITTAELSISGIAVRNKVYDATNVASISGTALLVGEIYDTVNIGISTSGASAVFNSVDVGNDLDVTISGYVLTGSHQSYYTLNQPTGLTANITVCVIGIKAQDVSIGYDPFRGIVDLDFNITSGASVLGTEFATVNLGEIKSEFTGSLSKEPGTGIGTYAITRNDFDLPISISDNYSINFVSGIYEITPIVLDVYINSGLTKVYGNDDPVLTYIYDIEDILPGDEVKNELGRETGNSVGYYDVIVGDFTVKSIDGDQSSISNYAINIINGTNAFYISKRPITLKADTKNINYGSSDVPLTVQIVQGSYAYSDALEGSLVREVGSNAGRYYINQGTLTITNSNNYSISFLRGDYYINALSIEISVKAPSNTNISNCPYKYYGDEDPTIEFNVSSSTPLLTGHTITGSLGRAEGIDAGRYDLNTNRIVVYDNDDNNITSNYYFNLNKAMPSDDDYQFVIAKRPLTVTARNITVEKDSAYLTRVDYYGLVYGQTKDDLDVIFDVVIPSTLVEGANTITLRRRARDGGTITEDKNYQMIDVSGILTYVDTDNSAIATAMPATSREYMNNNTKFTKFNLYTGTQIFEVNTISGQEPNRENVMVSVPLPNTLAGVKNVAVLFVSDSGTEVVTSSVEDGQITFNVTGRGYYLIAKRVNPLLLIIIILAIIAIVGTITYLLIKYYQTKNAKVYKPGKRDFAEYRTDDGGVSEAIDNESRDDILRNAFSGDAFNSLMNESYQDLLAEEDKKKEDATLSTDNKKSKKKKKSKEDNYNIEISHEDLEDLDGDEGIDIASIINERGTLGDVPTHMTTVYEDSAIAKDKNKDVEVSGSGMVENDFLSLIGNKKESNKIPQKLMKAEEGFGVKKVLVDADKPLTSSRIVRADDKLMKQEDSTETPVPTQKPNRAKRELTQADLDREAIESEIKKAREESNKKSSVFADVQSQFGELSSDFPVTEEPKAPVPKTESNKGPIKAPTKPGDNKGPIKAAPQDDMTLSTMDNKKVVNNDNMPKNLSRKSDTSNATIKRADENKEEL